MKYYISIIMLLFFISCKQKDHWGKYVVNDHIALDNYWRRVTGYDSLQITSNYEGDKLSYHFCYPNKWEFVKFRKDTVFIHDTVVFHDIPKKRKLRKRLKHYGNDTIFTTIPLYIDTTVDGKRILKLME